MLYTEAMEERQKVLKAAAGWLNTPYHPNARLRGVGCDCITFLAGSFEDAGVTPRIPIPNYSYQWLLHHDEELYLEGKDGLPGLLSYCTERPPLAERTPLPGDIVLWRMGRTFSHGAIVVEWPRIIHSPARMPVRYDEVNLCPWLLFFGRSDKREDNGKPRPMRVFTLKRWMGEA